MSNHTLIIDSASSAKDASKELGVSNIFKNNWCK